MKHPIYNLLRAAVIVSGVSTFWLLGAPEGTPHHLTGQWLGVLTAALSGLAYAKRPAQ